MFALALWEASDAVNLVTSLKKVYFNKDSMESGKTVVMGCCCVLKQRLCCSSAMVSAGI